MKREGIGVLCRRLHRQHAVAVIGAVAEDDGIEVVGGARAIAGRKGSAVLRHGAAGAKVAQDLEAARALAVLELVRHRAHAARAGEIENIGNLRIRIAKRSGSDDLANNGDGDRSEILERRLDVVLALVVLCGGDEAVEDAEIGCEGIERHAGVPHAVESDGASAGA